MKKAFISYRRQDSAGYVRAINDRLTDYFDPGQIFMDVEDIPLGTDFVQELEKNLQGCTVMLVVIGPAWLNIKNNSNERRLDNPQDFVRLEISRALEHDLTVIPILVNGAEMPGEQDLPENIKALSRRQALVLDNKHFDHGIADLIRWLERYLEQPEKQIIPTARTSNINIVLLIVCILVILALLSGLFFYFVRSDLFLTSTDTQQEIASLPAGFDCRKARNDIEDAICNSNEIRNIDKKLNQTYQALSERLPEEPQLSLAKRQKSWLKQRNTHIRQNCFTQPNQSRINHCIVNYYQQRISTLNRVSVSLFSRVRVMDPPSNIRNTPNGDVICQILQAQMIEVYNDPVRERDGGEWFWAKACGDDEKRWGVIHESQISRP